MQRTNRFVPQPPPFDGSLLFQRLPKKWLYDILRKVLRNHHWFNDGFRLSTLVLQVASPDIPGLVHVMKQKKKGQQSSLRRMEFESLASSRAVSDYAVTRTQLKSLTDLGLDLDVRNVTKLAIDRHGSFLAAKKVVAERRVKKWTRAAKKFGQDEIFEYEKLNMIALQYRLLCQALWKVWGVTKVEMQPTSPFLMKCFAHLSPSQRWRIHTIVCKIDSGNSVRLLEAALGKVPAPFHTEEQRPVVLHKVLDGIELFHLSPQAQNAAQEYLDQGKNSKLTMVQREILMIRRETEAAEANAPDYPPEYHKRIEALLGYVTSRIPNVTSIEDLEWSGPMPNRFTIQALARGEEEYPGQLSQFKRCVRLRALKLYMRKVGMDWNLVNYRQSAEIISAYVDYASKSPQWVVQQLLELLGHLDTHAHPNESQSQSSSSEEEPAPKRSKND